MEDNKLYTTIWRVVMASLCIIIATFSGCKMTTNYQDNSAMVEMVSKGADPLDARCAVMTTEGSLCAIRAATKNK